MAFEQNHMEGHSDIAQFLERFREQSERNASAKTERENVVPPKAPVNNPLAKQAEYNQSFEKLEEKMRELEEKFEASANQNKAILSELVQTREEMKQQRAREAFFDNISVTIENLKQSVEAIAKAQALSSYNVPSVQRGFDHERTVVSSVDKSPSMYHYEPDNYRQFREERLRRDEEEKERLISSLKQKASQLKAVNTALDREIKRVQEEKIEALRKSAEQAKEILSLRDQLTAAEERFKSFNFEGRIISIKQEYQQKVSSLENQLHKISDTCMKQVEEIESLKTENLRLHHVEQEAAALRAQLQNKTKEVQTLQNAIENVQNEHTKKAQNRLAAFMKRMQILESERQAISAQLSEAQQKLEQVTQEKDVLENNFKALLEQIKGNDVVIEGLKQKIAVLSQEKQILSQQKQALGAEKDTLQQQNVVLSRERETLSLQNKSLLQEKTNLQQQNQHLYLEKEGLAQQTDKLARYNQSLSQEKEALNRRRQDLEKENLELKKRSVPTPAPIRPVKPQESSALAHEDVTLRKAIMPEQPVTAPKAEAGVPSSERPMEVKDTTRSKVQTEADLPEIKVAKPVPQEEVYMDEDFLEKTDSFLGRMKWSIFREDR